MTYRSEARRQVFRCQNTVVVMGAPVVCDRVIVDPLNNVCDRPGDHVTWDEGRQEYT